MLALADFQAIVLTLQLAITTTLILLLVCIPTSWWLANSKSRFKPLFEALVALPLVLPPTVIGFYLLLLLAPDGIVGRVWGQLFGDTLPFSFTGLLIGSMIYSLPFVMQPLQNGFERLPKGLLDYASTLASPVDRFTSVILPLSKTSLITAACMGFAHTIGEFGVVLMIGGNIPGETQLLSIALFDRVENLQYQQAHILAAGLLIFSISMLALLYSLNRRGNKLWS
ncbi:molybdate transport system permease protein [Sinobacterium caligoides]|uniref:Molybdenum transport system permease n=1 Tax=Sinobacterium caligoides TaxID=933926 RepID=A0A3N2DQ43_9GAMM|nr:molybdate ABC transporter permease subunit [Sinobacterium caligoides]ROS01938.1 molybdate transport system permease protein [Sinobacterium caligoides]